MQCSLWYHEISIAPNNTLVLLNIRYFNGQIQSLYNEGHHYGDKEAMHSKYLL